MTPVMRRTGAFCVFCVALAGAAQAQTQEAFVLSSPALTDGGDLPADLRCTRDGGDGLSPPLAWTPPPSGTESLAVIMHHYPHGRIEGVDAPSQYWLLWNLPADLTGLPRGNPASVGDEGADKDARGTGYTPPCSPAGTRHAYTVTVYALDAAPMTLPAKDSVDVDWTALVDAMKGHVINSASLTFWN